MTKQEFEYDAFLSFNSKNEQVAKEFYDFLKRRRMKIFYTPEIKMPGSGQEKMDYGLTNSRTMLLLISKEGFGDYQASEYSAFYNIYIKNKEERKIYVIPTDKSIDEALGLYPATMLSLDRYHFLGKNNYNKLEINSLIRDFSPVQSKKVVEGEKRTTKPPISKTGKNRIKSPSLLKNKKTDKLHNENKNMSVIDVLFKPSNEFIIIGLTGRTGSGCSTVAELLSESNEDYRFFTKEKRKLLVDEKNEDRKYTICHNYLIENWKTPAIQIKVTHLIMLLCLKDGFSKFLDKLNGWIDTSHTEDIRYIKKELNNLDNLIREAEDIETKDDEKSVRFRQEREVRRKQKEKIIKEREDRISITNNVRNILSKKSEIKKIEDIAKDVFELLFDKTQSYRKRKDNKENERYNREAEERRKKINDFLGYEKTDGKLGCYYKEFQKELQNSSIETFQLFGNYIRYRTFFEQNEEESYNSITNLLNHTIQYHRNISTDEGKSTLIVIDALRNPYEISYLRKRYSSFYAMAVSANEADRKSRLRAKGHLDGKIKKFEETEYPSTKVSLREKYIYQNINECTEMSDIHIVNVDLKKENNATDKAAGIANLGKQLVRYISLMKHPGLVTPTAQERIMQIAFMAKYNSGCISRQVGAVITDKDFAIKTIGWNTVPEGQVPCLLRDCYTLLNTQDNKLKEIYSNYEIEQREKNKPNEKTFHECLEDKFGKKYDNELFVGRNISYCFREIYNKQTGEKNQVHTRALHAEENAFLQITKYGGQSILGGKLFSTASPCELCAKKASQLRMEEIYYIDLYPGISKEHIIECGKFRPKMILFEGVVGRAYIQLYQPIIPYKDEIDEIINSKNKK